MSKRKFKRRVTLESRLKSIYRDQVRRAKYHNRFLDYTAEDLLGFVRKNIDQYKRCPYCGLEYDNVNWSIDHKTPINRNGTFQFVNLGLCCLKCNIAKGQFDEIEWRELMNATHHWPLPLRKYLLCRLRAGARVQLFLKSDITPEALVDEE